MQLILIVIDVNVSILLTDLKNRFSICVSSIILVLTEPIFIWFAEKWMLHLEAGLQYINWLNTDYKKGGQIQYFKT